MATTLPIDHQSILRAAEEMINDYGCRAAAKATMRAQGLRAEGFESVANTWDLICEAIKDSAISHRGQPSLRRDNIPQVEGATAQQQPANLVREG